MLIVSLGGIQQAVPDIIVDKIILVMHLRNGILGIDDGKDLLGAVSTGYLQIDGALLQTMQARGELVKNITGQWNITSHVDWEKLPARVEAIIVSEIPVQEP